MGVNWSKDIDQNLIAATEQSRPMEGSLAVRRSQQCSDGVLWPM